MTILRSDFLEKKFISLQSIQILHLPTKTQYNAGENIDLTGIVVKGIFDNEFYHYEDVTESNITGFNSYPDTDSTQTITITVQGKTATFEVTVQPEPDLTIPSFSLIINTGSDKTFILPLRYSSSGTFHELLINWGDGTSQQTTGDAGMTAANQGIAHVYTIAGTYTITLTGTSYLSSYITANSYFGLGFTYNNTTGYNTLANRNKITGLSGSPDNLISPSMPTQTYKYNYMFQFCSNLRTACELPSMQLYDNCYSYMFDGCPINSAPVLPATTLAPYCYYYMFKGNTALSVAPNLPAEIMKNGCYAGMFMNCTNLYYTPVLRSMTLASSCYLNMFRGCTGIYMLQGLPAEGALPSACYEEIVAYCTGLERANIGSFTSAGSNALTNMFIGVNRSVNVYTTATTFNLLNNTVVKGSTTLVRQNP
jgi:hypothetical protein